jgi:hypothetical protein
MNVGFNSGRRFEEPLHALREGRAPLPNVLLEDGGGAQRQQPDHRAHLQAHGVAVGQAQHVVEEAILLVPHLGVAARSMAPAIHIEVLEEFQTPCPS